MFIKLINSFPKLNDDGTAKMKPNGQPTIVFKYSVHGTKEELAKYAEIQGENHRKDDTTGVPLYFTTRPAGVTAQLQISSNDKVFVDTTNIDLARALITQYGEVGMLMAKDLLGAAVPMTSMVQQPVQPKAGDPGLE